jgi:hypothetical protein
MQTLSGQLSLQLLLVLLYAGASPLVQSSVELQFLSLLEHAVDVLLYQQFSRPPIALSCCRLVGHKHAAQDSSCHQCIFLANSVLLQTSVWCLCFSTV